MLAATNDFEPCTPTRESSQVRNPAKIGGYKRESHRPGGRGASGFAWFLLFWLVSCAPGFAKTTISRFCDPWEESFAQTQVDCWLDDADWVVRFELRGSSAIVSPLQSQEETVVVAFAKDDTSVLYSFEIRCVKGRTDPAWDGLTRSPDGQVSGRWDTKGVTVLKENAGEATVVQLRLPLRSLETVYGRKLSADEVVRAAFLRSSRIRDREVWSSWQFFANRNGNPWGPSAFGLIPLDAQPNKDFALSQEPADAKAFRLAANKIRTDLDEYLQGRSLASATEAWYDQLGQFPEAEPDSLVWEGDAGTVLSNPTFQMPSGAWLARPFTVCIEWPTSQLATDRAGVEFQSGTAKLVEVAVKLPSQGSHSAQLSLRSSNGQAEGKLLEGSVSFEFDRARSPKFISVSYPGTGALADLRVFVDGSQVSVQVLRHPAPWEMAAGSEPPKEEFEDWTVKALKGNLKNLQVYSIGLTAIESLALAPEAALISWPEWNRKQKQLWLAHYAERHDRDGGYLYESLLHYSQSAQQAAVRANASNDRD
ncbi:MAG: hypothetical protein MUD03_06240 [Pirellula sp.]|nr:hypothetical protein [Pirellula sp.]